MADWTDQVIRSLLIWKETDIKIREFSVQEAGLELQELEVVV